MQLKNLTAGAALAAALLAAGVTAPAASANTDNCTEQFWMMGLRAAERTICDGPQAADGSWMRTRTFTAPAFTADGYSVCYGYGFCTFTMPKEVAAIDTTETYRVTPDTVLPDEPGYLGVTPAAGIA
jgi:hypothetical protein